MEVQPLLESQDECVAVVSIRYSGDKNTRSTIAKEAAMVVFAHKTGQYPPALTAELSALSFSVADAKAYLVSLRKG